MTGSCVQLTAPFAPAASGRAPAPRAAGELGVRSTPPTNHPLAPVADALLYFWPRANVDAALPLTITPAPREVRRVFAVRVDLGPLPVTD